jgi:glycerol-3-phosphate acyltransferase PlsY
MMAVLPWLVLAYIIGSFPSGLVVGKLFFHVDLRDYGSHNIGATNAYRVLGKCPAAAVLLLDAGKGALGVFLGQYGGSAVSEYQVYAMIGGGLLAILGHNCSLFLHFKGGKGVATGLGVILYLAPVETLIVFLTWAVIVALTKYVSLGSIVAAALVPVTMALFGEPAAVTGFGLLAALFVIVRHKDNIVRLLHGTELKVERIKRK